MKAALTLKTQQFLNEPSLKKVMAALGAGHALIVGGAVRAAILGEAPGDIDIATPLIPVEAAKKLDAAGIKVVPTGLDHGTITAVVDRRGFEITTLRQDVETDGRRAVVAFTKDWSVDAQRRDFTMNTLLMDMDGKIYDPTGMGVADLKNGLVRFVGDADTRIREDALRILRFFRFHARYGRGDPDVTALQACVHNAMLIENLSRERVTSEVERLMVAPRAGASINAMFDGRILYKLWQRRFDEKTYDVLRDLILNLNIAFPEILLLAYAVYENDIQKLDAKLTKTFVLSNRKKDYLTRCVRFVAEQSESLEKNLYLFGLEITLGGGILSSIFKDIGVNHDLLKVMREIKVLDERIKTTAIPVFPVTARDLMNTLSLPEGKALGDILRQVESWWLEKNTAPDRAACLEHAKTVTR